MEHVQQILNKLNENKDLSDQQRNTIPVILFFLSSVKEEELFLIHCLQRLMNPEDIENVQEDLINFYGKKIKREC
jgi:hypothetical protein